MHLEDLRIIVPLLFLKSLRTAAKVKLFNFEDPKQKSDFDTYYIQRYSLNLLEKLARNNIHNICEQSYNISSFADILGFL